MANNAKKTGANNTAKKKKADTKVWAVRILVCLLALCFIGGTVIYLFLR